MTADTLHNTEPGCRSYETDYYGWIQDQIALLKAGRLSEIDVQNIAEEIKGVGTRQYDRLENAARALIYNLLKWDLQPDRRSQSMVFSIDAHRDRIARLLDRNPSLAVRAPEALAEGYHYAIYDMIRDSDLPDSAFAPDCPYDWETIRSRLVEFQGADSPDGSEHP
ncbi:DUF29 domain-containing protein [Rhodopseudomonas palustris]|uniref:DUF29 domain-containing protein n=1 Tax=Rhodopseudomonas palustris TaxID=1076 RepID=A0A418UXM3_RHOPL|nr:DUF29 domain-containing protein [Rhodopseudomonas palustris]RJF66287.1 DUF29 domain-containing protein [Rhodopseudomonas palustris]